MRRIFAVVAALLLVPFGFFLMAILTNPNANESSKWGEVGGLIIGYIIGTVFLSGFTVLFMDGFND